MNPAAQEFVPRKKRTTDPSAVHPANRGPLPPPPPPPPPPPQQQQQPPLQQQQQTKLRASAPAFVPKASTVSAAPPPPPPLLTQPTAVAASSVPAPPQAAQHVDPGAFGGSDSQPSPGSKTLSLNAVPYTPTNPKIAAKFPSTPQVQRNASTPDAQSAAQQQQPPPPPPQQQQQQEHSEESHKSQPLGLANRADSVPLEGSVGSASAADDSGNSVLQSISALGAVVENDFSGSTLPSVFGVSVLAKPPPSEPIRFNTVWALHADDHPTTFGAPLAYDPVLVHLVGDVECFWRLWRYLPPPSALAPAFTYHWFRRDIKPNWEHARNKNGGTITIVIFDRDKPGLNSKQTMDDAFMTMLMACCGETLAESTTNLNGIMLKVRQNKPTTVQIWTANSDQRKLKALAGSLRNLLEKVIGPKPLQKMEYFSHQQTQVGGPGSLAGRMKGKPTRITPDFTL